MTDQESEILIQMQLAIGKIEGKLAELKSQFTSFKESLLCDDGSSILERKELVDQLYQTVSDVLEKE